MYVYIGVGGAEAPDVGVLDEEMALFQDLGIPPADMKGEDKLMRMEVSDDEDDEVTKKREAKVHAEALLKDLAVEVGVRCGLVWVSVEWVSLGE